MASTFGSDIDQNNIESEMQAMCIMRYFSAKFRWSWTEKFDFNANQTLVGRVKHISPYPLFWSGYFMRDDTYAKLKVLYNVRTQVSRVLLISPYA